MRTLWQILLGIYISLLVLTNIQPLQAEQIDADQTGSGQRGTGTEQAVPPQSGVKQAPAEQSTTPATQSPEAQATVVRALLYKAAKLVTHRQNIEAQQLYHQALEIDPNNSAAHAGLGWTLYDTGKYSQGISEEKKSLAIDQNNALAHHYLACIYLAKGRNQEAADEYRIEYQIDPKRRCHCGPIENVLKLYPTRRVEK